MRKLWLKLKSQWLTYYSTSFIYNVLPLLVFVLVSFFMNLTKSGFQVTVLARFPLSKNETFLFSVETVMLMFYGSKEKFHFSFTDVLVVTCVI